MAVIDDALKFTLKWEGGYVNNPADYGGATNYGVTQRTYDIYRSNRKLATQSVKNITMAEVTDIYKNQYWTPAQCDRMQPELAIVMFDTAVNFGVGGAVEFLQEAAGLSADGQWGPNTETAFKKSNTFQFAQKVVVGRKAYRRKRVTEDPSQKVFLDGWLNRDDDLLDLINARYNNANPPVVKAHTITATQDTYLKIRPTDASKLADNEKVFCPKGKTYGVVWESGTAENAHIKVSLDYKAGNWYVFPGHWSGLDYKPTTQPTKPVQGRPRKVVYFSQRDNYRDSTRTCFSSSDAMLLKWYKPSAINNDDEYIKVVFSIGDTTKADVQLKALKHYGIDATYTQSMSIPELKQHLDKGPVAIGILHHGSPQYPSGGGHWILVQDYIEDKNAPGGTWFMVNDPWGEIDNATGTYPVTDGENVRYSAGLLEARWTVSGSNDGWAVYVA